MPIISASEETTPLIGGSALKTAIDIPLVRSRRACGITSYGQSPAEGHILPTSIIVRKPLLTLQQRYLVATIILISISASTTSMSIHMMIVPLTTSESMTLSCPREMSPPYTTARPRMPVYHSPWTLLVTTGVALFRY